MIKIPLTQNRIALIDNKDYSKLSKFSWCAEKARNKFYARTTVDKKALRMHQLIMGKKQGFEIDHKNGDGLDNRRCNLRFCTHSQNLMNFKSKRIYRGVYWSEEKKKWRVYICVNYRSKFCGYFSSKRNAALAYNAKAKELFGDFANLNTIKEQETNGSSKQGHREVVSRKPLR